ncbi:MAG: type III PLP-dependent enzyme [Rhodospirillales bacterium]|nr:type III PLP-dependent enzyme [Rhodospirillales bacterium]
MSLKHFATVEQMIAELAPGYPVYCLRPKELERNAKLFLDTFPGRVLYAVKCNPELNVLNALYKAGIRHFDTASLNEIALIRENFPLADCYFMHPVKSRSAISAAKDVYSVDHFVIDHEDELDKIVDAIGGGDGKVCLVRVITPPANAAYNLSQKFGATVEEAPALLNRVAREGFQPGLAFHVGSQCRSPEAFSAAIRIMGQVVDKSDVHIHYLDVGGGFPVEYVDDAPPPLKDFVDAITSTLREINLRGDCVLMCEPGRGMVASGSSLVVQVMLRKDSSVYINDGVYHSLSETLTAGVRLPMRVIRPCKQVSSDLTPFAIFGPTCDSTDRIPGEIMLPSCIREGDWIEIGQAGAYSNAMTSRFNGFIAETFVNIDEAPLMPTK